MDALVVVSKMDSGLSVKLPKNVLEQLEIKENDELLFEVKDKEVVLKSNKKPFIEQLFEGFNPDEYYKNDFGNQEDDWGAAVGNEDW